MHYSTCWTSAVVLLNSSMYLVPMHNLCFDRALAASSSDEKRTKASPVALPSAWWTNKTPSSPSKTSTGSGCCLKNSIWNEFPLAWKRCWRKCFGKVGMVRWWWSWCESVVWVQRKPCCCKLCKFTTFDLKVEEMRCENAGKIYSSKLYVQSQDILGTIHQ